MSYVVIQTTTDKEVHAKSLANKILASKFGACVQISNIESHYIWNGKVEESKELLLSIKTTQDKFLEVEKLIKENHHYETPEIISIPISSGSNEYLTWIDNSLS